MLETSGDKKKSERTKKKNDIDNKYEELTYKTTNAWDNPHFDKKCINALIEDYKAFMNKAKTEREFIKESVALAKKNKFKNLDEISEGSLKPGDKVYRVVKDRLMLLSVGPKACRRRHQNSWSPCRLS